MSNFSLILFSVLIILTMFVMLVCLIFIAYDKFVSHIINRYKIKKYTLKISDIKSTINSYNIDDPDNVLSSYDLKHLKLELEKTQNKLNSILPEKEESYIDLEDVEITERVKLIIDNMISVEVYSVVKRYTTTNKKYEITKLDEDIKIISTKVFNSLNKDLFNTSLVFTNEYIMNYIVGQSFNLLLNITTTYNENKAFG